MKNKIQITIPEPCHEDWAMMTINQKGKFCISCQKNVIDFTTSSDAIIVKAYKENPKLCGRFTAIQLNRNLKIPQEKNSIWMLIAASIITFLGLGNQEIKAQEIVKIDISDNLTLKDSTFIKPQKGTKNYIGVVYDENSNPLPGATINIKDFKNNSHANSNGEFSIQAKKDDVLVFSYIGYENEELKLKDNNASIKIYMNTPSVMGEVIIVKYKKD